jgi:hypothetical protein
VKEHRRRKDDPWHRLIKKPLLALSIIMISVSCARFIVPVTIDQRIGDFLSGSLGGAGLALLLDVINDVSKTREWLTLHDQNEELLTRNRSSTRRAFQLGFILFKYWNVVWCFDDFIQMRSEMCPIIQELFEGLDLKIQGQEFLDRIDAIRVDEPRTGSGGPNAAKAMQSLTTMGLAIFANKVENRHDSEVRSAFEAGFALDDAIWLAGGGDRISVGLAQQTIDCLNGMRVDPSILRLTNKVFDDWQNGGLDVDIVRRYLIVLYYYLLFFGQEENHASQVLLELARGDLDPRQKDFEVLLDNFLDNLKEHPDVVRFGTSFSSVQSSRY